MVNWNLFKYHIIKCEFRAEGAKKVILGIYFVYPKKSIKIQEYLKNSKKNPKNILGNFQDGKFQDAISRKKILVFHELYSTDSDR